MRQVSFFLECVLKTVTTPTGFMPTKWLLLSHPPLQLTCSTHYYIAQLSQHQSLEVVCAVHVCNMF